MLATPWREPFDDPDWTFEVKWDGVRVLVEIDDAKVTLRSRRGRVMTDTYPELTGRWPRVEAVVDGEIVAFDPAGQPSFGLLQRRMNLSGRGAAEAAQTVPVTLVLFDLIHHAGPVTELPLETRRERLAGLAPSWAVVSDQVPEHGTALAEAVVARGMEGIVGKRRGSRYQPGRRSPDWRKIVHRRSGRFVVGGYLPGDGMRTDTFASLLLGLYRGDELRFVGAVGSGFDDLALELIREGIDHLATDRSPFATDRSIPRSARWVEPVLVTVVEYREWTSDDHLRAPVFKGFVDDPPEATTWEAEGP
jgi:bifunctional non-homologous end joining protein LigD